MLGGFHFNDRRYADDDLTMGSIDPYQIFRIFHEILFLRVGDGRRADIAYMVDQSHNLKGKIEAMMQTVMNAQELYAKAALVDHDALVGAQRTADLVRAEACLQDAFKPDVRPAIAEWRRSRGLPRDPSSCLSPKWLPGTHLPRTRRAQCGKRRVVCVRAGCRAPVAQLDRPCRVKKRIHHRAAPFRPDCFCVAAAAHLRLQDVRWRSRAEGRLVRVCAAAKCTRSWERMVPASRR